MFGKRALNSGISRLLIEVVWKCKLKWPVSVHTLERERFMAAKLNF